MINIRSIDLIWPKTVIKIITLFLEVLIVYDQEQEKS